MKKLIFIIFFLTSTFITANSNIQKAIAVAIYHEDETGENVQHKKITTYDYNGTCYTKIAIFGSYDKNTKVEVRVGDSLGIYQSNTPLFNKYTKKIFGYELTFKHQNVSKGYFEVKVDNKLYDSKTFIK